MPPPDVRLRLGLLLRQSHQRAANALNEALSPLGLTGRHFGVMLLLARDGVSTQRDLIRQTGSDKAGMTRTVEDLEGLGYVTRTQSAHDKRVADIVLSAAGREAFDDARQRADGAARQLFDGFNAEELESLAAALDRFVDGPERRIT